MLKPIAAALAAAALTAGGFLATGSDKPGSSAERTAYSALYALKHRNFGRFCSYLTQELGGSGTACATNNAAGWAQNLMWGGVDVFADNSTIVVGSRRDVDENTVTYDLLISDPQESVYRLTIDRQASGNWRISAIEYVGDGIAP